MSTAIWAKCENSIYAVPKSTTQASNLSLEFFFSIVVDGYWSPRLDLHGNPDPEWSSWPVFKFKILEILIEGTHDSSKHDRLGVLVLV